MSSNLYCMMIDHGEYEITFICTEKNCNRQDRRLCYLCLKDDKHRHCRDNNNHLLDIKEFSRLIKKKRIDSYKRRCEYYQTFKETINRLNNCIQNITEMLKTLQQFIQDFEKQKISEVDNILIEDLLDEKNFLYSREILDKAINIDQYQYSTSEQIIKIGERLRNIWNFFKEEMQEKIDDKIKLCKAEIRQFQNIKLQSFLSATTSSDFCYLSLLNENSIQIWDLRRCTKIFQDEPPHQRQNINQKKNIFHTAQFTLDSKYLYYGQGEGMLNQLPLKNLDKKDEVLLNCQFIQTIKILTNDRMLLGTSDGQIIDYEWGRYSNDVIRQKYGICLIEYFDSYNMVTSVNDKNEIQFWDLNKQIEIGTMKFKLSTKIKQIEIIKKSNQLFLLDQEQKLRIYIIKYNQEQKSCQEKESLESHNIFSIQQVFGQNYYIIICDNILSFYDIPHDNHIRTIKHEISYNCKKYTIIIQRLEHNSSIESFKRIDFNI